MPEVNELRKGLSDLVHECLCTQGPKVEWPDYEEYGGTIGAIGEGSYKTLWRLLHNPEIAAKFDRLRSKTVGL